MRMFNLSPATFLIVLPLTGIAGFVDAIAGGGGLISLPAYIIAGLPAHNAIATNKMSSGMGTALATFRYARNGYIKWKLSALCVVFAFIGGTLGARIALMIDDRYFKMMLLVILPVSAVLILRSKTLENGLPPFEPLKTAVISCAVALVIGTYDGFYGPGTGTFLILLLTGLARFRLTEANGTAKAINLATNVASFTVYFLSGNVLPLLGFLAGLTNMAGAWLGTRLFDRVQAKAVRPVMMAVLAIFFVRVISDLVG